MRIPAATFPETECNGVGKYLHRVTSLDQIHSGTRGVIPYLPEAVWKDLHLPHIQVPADHIAVEVSQDHTLRDLFHLVPPDLQVHQVVHQAVPQAAEVAADHLPEEDSKLKVKKIVIQ